MRRLLALLVALALCLTGCQLPEQLPGAPRKQYTATFLDVFDTVTTVLGRADSQEDFSRNAQALHDSLLRYHRLFDIYNTYEGITNLKDVNDAAGQGPVRVDPDIIRLLQDCAEYYRLTEGRVNAAMGSVLRLWHDARQSGIHDPTAARLPEADALREAAGHTDWEDVVIDEAASTVCLRDPEMSLDVGAIAKGWAAQKVAENAPEGLLISVGGNVCATGPKAENTPWVVGIQNPDGSADYLHTIYLSRGCVVTSGDYQRMYVVDGKPYHHIIDPDTLYPGTLWRSVSVVCQDSALADALSTALFLLPQEQGQKLLDGCNAQAMWLDADFNRFYSPGFRELIKT